MAKNTRWSKSVFSKSKSLKATRLRKVFDHVAFQFIAFAAFVAAMVAIMTAGFDVHDRKLSESIIGQVAPYTVEATRDFPFSEKDVEASERIRLNISASVPSVYDWQEGLGEGLREQLRAAFTAMREAMAVAIRDDLMARSPERLEAMIEQAPGTNLTHRMLIDSVPPDRRVGIAQQLREEHFDPNLKVHIADADFDAFARRGFPMDVENVLGAMVSEAMSSLIIANVRRIEREREHGIYLRRLRHDKLLIEYHVTDLEGRFVGLEGVPRLIEDAARREMVSVQGGDMRQAIMSTATVLVRPNTTFNESKTLEKRKIARESVADQIIREDFRKGQIIVDKGHIVTERHYRIIQKMLQDDESFQQTQILTGIVVFCLLLVMTLYIFGRKNIRKFKPQPKDIVFMGTTILLMLLITRMGVAMSHALSEQLSAIPVQAWYFAIPVAAGGMLIRLVLNSEHAVIFTILFSLLVGVVADNSLFFASYTAIGTLVGISSVQQVKHRMALMWSGLAVGGINAAMIVGFLLIEGNLFEFSTVTFIVLGFVGGLAAGFFISAVLPLFEAVFSYTTDIKLLELANLNHPLLRDLILRSPGSYHHSMMVGSLCESAAEAIGCNPLLSRVGSYYHDIGKSKNPQYFAENQKLGENPHDRLKPNMSALIIKSHVKDGLDMARQHRLPVEIQDFIAQHHGTSLIQYFYHKAKQLEDPDIPEVDEKDYRYPGPKPQSRETAICLLADTIEAASRAMRDPSPARLKGLVHTMISKAFTDGQLNECDLTLKDLNSIAGAFTRILTGIYHHRPEYPGQNKKDGDKEGGRSQQDTEPNKRPRASRSPKTTTANHKRPATESAAPRQDQKPDKDNIIAPTDVSSDVWEIAPDARDTDSKAQNASRDNPSGQSPTTSRRQGTEPDGGGEHRRALPRFSTT